MLYFAYGSNLDRSQMRKRCPSAVPHGRAVLPSHALVFGGHSHRWGGAVASVVRAKGRDVQGILYALSENDLLMLDRIEGHPFAYERVQRIVGDETGRRRRVFVYIQPEDRIERWVPSRDYYAVLRRAYVRLGFDRRQLAVAARVAA